MSNKIMTRKIKLTQTRSRIGSQKNQINSLRGLGLWKINSSSVLENTPEIRGMINKVNHLVRIELLD
ncbi:MAG: 50S ribosomal protein L30 [SAR324 cluster bacterium]|nr:50S ribosomal protein L30 [SAR324 cluster bacterium]